MSVSKSWHFKDLTATLWFGIFELLWHFPLFPLVWGFFQCSKWNWKKADRNGNNLILWTAAIFEHRALHSAAPTSNDSICLRHVLATKHCLHCAKVQRQSTNFSTQLATLYYRRKRGKRKRRKTSAVGQQTLPPLAIGGHIGHTQSS